MIDTILLHGRGATESLKVAGKPPGQGSSLRFKMTEALLKECTESESAVHARLPAQLFHAAVPADRLLTQPGCDLMLKSFRLPPSGWTKPALSDCFSAISASEPREPWMTTTTCAERLKPISNDVNKAACGRALTNQSKNRAVLSAVF